jgi:hypothetical protein
MVAKIKGDIMQSKGLAHVRDALPKLVSGQISTRPIIDSVEAVHGKNHVSPRGGTDESN